jgi:hypothetical protein
MKTIETEIQKLRQLSVGQLVDKYREVLGKEPRVRHKEFLWKRICWKLEEQRTGGLSAVARARLEALIAEIDLPVEENRRRVTGPLRGKNRASDEKPGTTYSRTYKGQEIRAVVVEAGYEWDGKVYRSLTAVARAVTGSAWNGRLFFGLTKRKKQ